MEIHNQKDMDLETDHNIIIVQAKDRIRIWEMLWEEYE